MINSINPADLQEIKRPGSAIKLTESVLQIRLNYSSILLLFSILKGNRDK